MIPSKLLVVLPIETMRCVEISPMSCECVCTCVAERYIYTLMPRQRVVHMRFWANARELFPWISMPDIRWGSLSLWIWWTYATMILWGCFDTLPSHNAIYSLIVSHNLYDINRRPWSKFLLFRNYWKPVSHLPWFGPLEGVYHSTRQV